jgi:hypothetical protein
VDLEKREKIGGGFGENKKSEVDLEKRPEKLILNIIKVILKKILILLKLYY